MQARTLILAGVLAGIVVALRHASHADEIVPVVVAPPREVAPAPTSPTSFHPAPAIPKVAAPVPELGELKAALAGVLDEGPVVETTGDPRAAVAGKVRDLASGEELAGVVVIATSPTLEHAQTAITDENGDYQMIDLPPGDYLLTFYYADITLERAGLALDAGHALHLPVVLERDDRPPIIEVALTEGDLTIDEAYIRNIPVLGRTFESALGAAAGSQVDGTGVSFTGVTSLENTYIVDEE